MKKELSDYINLYFGCDVVGTYNDASGSRGILTGVTNGGTECEIQFYEEDGFNVSESPEFNDTKEVKLILRPLIDMTPQEAGDYAEFYNNGKKIPDQAEVEIKPHESGSVHVSIQLDGNGISLFPGGPHGDRSEAFRYLLSRGFDLFGLIPEGMAIDKTKMNEPCPTRS